MFDPNDRGFPTSWTDALAFEWVKAHIDEAETVDEFARMFIDAKDAIRNAVEKTYGKPGY